MPSVRESTTDPGKPQRSLTEPMDDEHPWVLLLGFQFMSVLRHDLVYRRNRLCHLKMSQTRFNALAR
jgi:hypothetical protein